MEKVENKVEQISEKLLSHYYGLCERTGDSFWGEPFNAISNAAFLIAAIYVFRFLKNHNDARGFWVFDIYLLNFLMFCIATASFTFHTMPNIYTEKADMIFIVSFIVVYFVSAMFRIAKCSLFEFTVSCLAFLGFTYFVVDQFPNSLNDSIAYLSSMMALIFIAIYLNIKKRTSARQYLLAAVLGVCSLFCRAIDNAVCEVVGMGTHFMWHILNSILMTILVVQLIRNVNRKARMLRAASEHLA
jgi:hypothetical protein